MAFLGDSFDANLAAACGADHALYLELRTAFLSSAERQLDLMRRARCDGNWLVAADRLSGLAASFHDPALMAMAEEARSGAPGDPRVLREIAAHLDDIAQRG